VADRAEYVLRTIEVRHIARPHGPGRENPPHLWDLRRFVEACEGLPDGLVVEMSAGTSDNVGRRNIIFAVRQVEPVTDQMVEERARALSWFRRSPKDEDEENT
jgi:hypothetical protein